MNTYTTHAVDTIVFGSFKYIYIYISYIYIYNLYACENLQRMVVEVRYTFYNVTHPDRLFVNKMIDTTFDDGTLHVFATLKLQRTSCYLT